MEKLTNLFLDYRKSYNVFKKLPLIIFFVILAISILLGIIDTAAPFTEMGYEGASIIVMPLIGIVAAMINAFTYSVAISPIVIIVDAKLKEIGNEAE